MKVKYLKSMAAAALVQAEAATAAELSSDGRVTFEAGTGGGPGPIDPVDPPTPVDPYPDPEPGTDGPLSIDFVAGFEFGSNEISTEDRTYYAIAQKVKMSTTGLYEYRPNYVQVTDNRGTNDGWRLKVKQEGQFTSSDANAVNTELTGAVISMDDGWVNTMMETTTDGVTTSKVVLDPEGAASTVMTAQKGKEAGTWFGIYGAQDDLQNTDAYGNTVQDDHGDTTMFNPSVTLELPGKTLKDAVTYTTALRWTLEDTPS